MYGGSGQCFNVDQLEISKYFQPNQWYYCTDDKLNQCKNFVRQSGCVHPHQQYYWNWWNWLIYQSVIYQTKLSKTLFETPLHIKTEKGKGNREAGKKGGGNQMINKKYTKLLNKIKFWFS